MFLDCFTYGWMDDRGTKLFNVEGIFHVVWDIEFMWYEVYMYHLLNRL